MMPGVRNLRSHVSILTFHVSLMRPGRSNPEILRDDMRHNVFSDLRSTCRTGPGRSRDVSDWSPGLRGKCQTGPRAPRDVSDWSLGSTGRVRLVPGLRGTCQTGPRAPRDLSDWSLGSTGRVGLVPGLHGTYFTCPWTRVVAMNWSVVSHELSPCPWGRVSDWSGALRNTVSD